MDGAIDPYRSMRLTENSGVVQVAFREIEINIMMKEKSIKKKKEKDLKILFLKFLWDKWLALVSGLYSKTED